MQIKKMIKFTETSIFKAKTDINVDATYHKVFPNESYIIQGFTFNMHSILMPLRDAKELICMLKFGSIELDWSFSLSPVFPEFAGTPVIYNLDFILKN